MLHTQQRLDDWNSHRHYSVGLAQSSYQVEAAQRLRHRVFVEELGAPARHHAPGIDADLHDVHCEHVIVLDEQLGKVVGTCRILTPDAAERARLYCLENAFDLTRLQHLRPSLVEFGRACIHPDYRDETITALMWGKLEEFMGRNGYRYLIGCASMGMADGGHQAANLFVQEIDRHLAPLEYRVFPRHPLPFERLVTGHRAEVPLLLDSHLRAGAWICGDPAWNPDFNTVDLPLLLPMERLKARYSRQLQKV